MRPTAGSILLTGTFLVLAIPPLIFVLLALYSETGVSQTASTPAFQDMAGHRNRAVVSLPVPLPVGLPPVLG